MCTCENVPLAFFREEERVARKGYTCGECGKVIAPRTKYVYLVGKEYSDYSNVWVFRMCIECKSDWEQLLDIQSKLGEEECYCLRTLREQIDAVMSEALELGILEPSDPFVLRWQTTKDIIVETSEQIGLFE